MDQCMDMRLSMPMQLHTDAHTSVRARAHVHVHVHAHMCMCMRIACPGATASSNAHAAYVAPRYTNGSAHGRSGSGPPTYMCVGDQAAILPAKRGRAESE